MIPVRFADNKKNNRDADTIRAFTITLIAAASFDNFRQVLEHAKQ